MIRKTASNSFLALLVFLSACTVGPNYARPPVETPGNYKEAADWKVAQPKDDVIRGAWWEIFNDSRLNALEEQVDISNQSVAAAEAQFRQARALVQAARAAYFPTVTIGVGVTRSLQSSTVSSGPSGSAKAITEYSLLSTCLGNWTSGAAFAAPSSPAKEMPRPARRTSKRRA